MAWTKCILDNSPTGNLTLIDDSGFSYSAIIQTGSPDEVAKFIASAYDALLQSLTAQDSTSKTCASILAQAQDKLTAQPITVGG